MTTEEFVKNFYLEKKESLEFYFKKDGGTEASRLIAELKLDEPKTEKLKKVLNCAFTDIFYTILLGFDGSTSIGNSQQETFKIYDEEENLISDCGDIEAEAYEYFHNNKLEIENSNCDFVVTLKYKNIEKNEPFKTNKKIQLKFDINESIEFGHKEFIDTKIVFPGDSVDALIKLDSINECENKLKVRMCFEIREGENIIGTGEIKKIVNHKLLKTYR